MKPKPFSVLNHFTVPVSSTAVSEDGPLDVPAPKLARDGVVGFAVLSRTNPDFEGFTRLHGINAALS
jgi:hypothetical protein